MAHSQHSPPLRQHYLLSHVNRTTNFNHTDRVNMVRHFKVICKSVAVLVTLLEQIKMTPISCN